jgi:hypothetical protein
LQGRAGSEDLLKKIPGISLTLLELLKWTITVEKDIDDDDMFESKILTKKNMPVNPIDKVELCKIF